MRLSNLPRGFESHRFRLVYVVETVGVDPTRTGLQDQSPEPLVPPRCSCYLFKGSKSEIIKMASCEAI